MPIDLVCTCGAKFSLGEARAGKPFRCYMCMAELVPTLTGQEASSGVVEPDINPEEKANEPAIVPATQPRPIAPLQYGPSGLTRSALLRWAAYGGGAITLLALAYAGWRWFTDPYAGSLPGDPAGEFYSVMVAAFSPDGKLAVTSDQKELKVWDLSTRQVVRRLKGHADVVSAGSFSRDGTQFVSGSFDQTVSIWDFASGEEVRRFGGLPAAPLSVRFSADEKYIVAGCLSHKVLLLPIDENQLNWHTQGGNIGWRRQSADLHLDSLRSLRETDAFLKNLPTKTAEGLDAKIKPLPSADELHARYREHTSKMREGEVSMARAGLIGLDTYLEAVVNHEGLLICGSTSHGVELWSLEEMRKQPNRTTIYHDGQTETKFGIIGFQAQLPTVRKPRGITKAFAVSADGQFAASGNGLERESQEGDNHIRIWSVDRLNRLPHQTLKGHTEPVTALAFSPDGTRILSGSIDGTLRLWDLTTGKELQRMSGHGLRFPKRLEISPQGDLAICGDERRAATLWRLP